MEKQTLCELAEIGEGVDLEFKSAKGGLPQSLWATYSAMANTEGGKIILGVREANGKCEVQGVPNPNQQKKQFWDAIQNRSTVNLNLLRENDVETVDIDGKSVIVINVPLAERRWRPVYIGQNPLTGTYIRYNEGDYLCNKQEVKRMLSDQSEISFDSRVLEDFTEADIDKTTLQQYRNRFSARAPQHVWLNEDGPAFLEKLGGWSVDRKTKKQGPTVAGILMFGTEDAVRDILKEGVHYHVDYRERVSDRISDRWLDRVTIDGTWTPNLFQFFLKVYSKLVGNLKLPFNYIAPEVTLFSDPVRAGMTPVHEALQEALVNAIVHADYQGEGGIVIERFPKRFEMSNPGRLLVSIDQLYRGSFSECRNPSLQKMFQMIGAGDKAGAGFDKIRSGWSSQKWFPPNMEQTMKPERSLLILEMTSLLPDGFVDKLRTELGALFEQIGKEEIEILAIASAEGDVSNARIQQISTTHSTDITKKFQKLVEMNLLVMESSGRWAKYHLPAGLQQSLKDWSLPTNDGSLPNNDESLPTNSRDNGDAAECGIHQNLNIGEEIRGKKRIAREKMEEMILKICQNDFLTATQIATILERKPKTVQSKYIPRLLESKRLIPRYPTHPTHPNQSYKTRQDEQEN